MQLTEKLDTGNERTFEKLFKLYYTHLCFFARKFVDDDLEAENIVQEIFSEIWKRKPFFNAEIAFKSYLFRSVRNSCFNFLRDKKIKD